MPQLPAVRGWLLTRVTDSLQDAGYDLSYGADSGNPWVGIAAENLRLRGPGIELESEFLHLSYSLPALLTGQLPLSIKGQGLKGNITLSELESSQSGPSLPIRPRLRQVELEDVSLNANDIPYTLPNFRLSNLRVSSKGDSLHVLTTLFTDEGAANVDADISLQPFELQANVSQADVRIARHWWDGITGGSASGILTVKDGLLSADAEIKNGSIVFLDGEARSISGRASYSYPRVSAILQGQTLGGKVDVVGGVDIISAKWFGELSGDVELKETAQWLAKGRLPFDISGVPISGKATTQVRARGWTDAEVTGTANGGGSLLGLPVNDLRADFSYSTTEGTTVSTTAALADGAVSANLAPESGGFVFTLNGSDIQASPTLKSDLDFEFRRSTTGVSGFSNANLIGNFLNKEVNLNLDGNIDGDGWQGFIAGSGLGGRLEGAAVVQNGQINGQVSADDLLFPYVNRAANLQLQANGPIDNLPLSLSINAAEPLYLSLDNLEVQSDFRGRISARLRESSLTNISSQFDKLNLSGNLRLNAESGELNYQLGETKLLGIAQGSLQIPTGTLEVKDQTLSTVAKVQSQEFTLARMTLPPLDAQLNLSYSDTFSASLFAPEQGFEGSFQNGLFKANLDGLPIRIFGQDLIFRGEAQTDIENSLTELELDLSAESPRYELGLKGNADQFDARFKSKTDPSSTLLAKLSLNQKTAQLNGKLDQLDVTGVGSIEGTFSTGTVHIRDRENDLNLRFEGPVTNIDWTSQGQLDLAPIAKVLGLDLTGKAQTNLRSSQTGYVGQTDIQGSLSQIPFDVDLIGQDRSLILRGNSTLLGYNTNLEGFLQPAIDLSITNDLGRLTLLPNSGTYELIGEGRTPLWSAAGFELEEQAWNLKAKLSTQEANLTLGDSQAKASLQTGGWLVEADIQQAITRGSKIIVLDAQGELSQTRPEGNIRGSLQLPSASLDLTGDLAALALAGNIPASDLSTLFGLPFSLAGDIALDSRINLRDGFSYVGTANWQANQEALLLTAQGKNTNWTLDAQHKDLRLSYSNPGFNVNAQSFALDPFLETNLGAELTGNLRNLGTGWQGKLDLNSTRWQGSSHLLGIGQSLQLNSSLQNDLFSSSVQGALLPNLNLQINASHTLFEVKSRLNGVISNPSIEGYLKIQDYSSPTRLGLKVAGQTFDFSRKQETGLKITGESLDVYLSNGRLTGDVSQKLYLHDELHVLSGKLSGNLESPELIAKLEGNHLSGPISIENNQLNAALLANTTAWLSSVPVRASPLQLDLNLQADRAWQLKLLSKESTQQGFLPELSLQGSISGQGVNYAGEGFINLSEEAIPFDLEGKAALLKAQAQFKDSELEKFIPNANLSGKLNGFLTLDLSKPQALDLKLKALGSLADQHFDLDILSNGDFPLRLQGEIEDIQIAIQKEETSLGFKLLSEQRPLNITGQLLFAPQLELLANGQLQTAPFTLQANYHQSEQSANWSANLGNSNWQGNLNDGALDSILQLSEDVFPYAGQAQLEAKLSSGQLSLDSLAINTKLAGQELTLNLAGPTWPETELVGSLQSSLLQTYDIAFEKHASGYTLQAAQDELDLDITLSNAFSLTTLDLRGTADFPLSNKTTLDANLHWQSQQGFSGSAFLSSSSSSMRADLQALGQGSLKLEGDAFIHDESLASLSLILPQNPFSQSELSGNIFVNTELKKLWPLYPGEPLYVESQLEVAGPSLQPELKGQVELKGASQAEGYLELFGRQGTLELNGRGLSVSANLTDQGWQLKAVTEAFDASALIPQLTSPKLTSQFSATQAWGTPLSFRTSELSLTMPHSHITGNLYYQAGLSGNFATSFDLADMQLGVPLQGELAGQVSLGPLQSNQDSNSLSGVIKASDLSWADSGAFLDGNLILTGPLSEPNLGLQLTGSGVANGVLQASVNTNEISLNSNLQLADFKTAMNLKVTQTSAEASGNLSYQDYSLVFTPTSKEHQLQLEGRDKLKDWLISIDLQAKRGQLSGPLNSLSSFLKGQADLALTWPATRKTDQSEPSWATGQVSDFTLGVIPIGNMRFSGTRTKNLDLSIQGDNIDASINLNNATWQLNRLNLALPAIKAHFSGSGTRNDAQLLSVLEGQVSQESFTLPMTINLQEGRLSLFSDSEFLGGHLKVETSATVADGWSGGLKITSVLGQDLSLTGRLSGPLSAPQLSADLLSELANTELKGSLLASSSKLSLNQQLTSNLLKDPLLIQAELYPNLDLRFKGSGARQLHITRQDGLLAATGSLQLIAGPLEANFQSLGQDETTTADWLELSLTSPTLEGLKLSTRLPKEKPEDFLKQITSKGLSFKGQEATKGDILLSFTQGVQVDVNDFFWQAPAGDLNLAGMINAQDGKLLGTWQGNSTETFPWLSSLDNLTFETSLDSKQISINAQGTSSSLKARYLRDRAEASLEANIQTNSGSNVIRLHFVNQTLEGTINAHAFPLVNIDSETSTELNGSLEIKKNYVQSDLQLTIGKGNILASGGFDLHSFFPNLKPSHKQDTLNIQLEDILSQNLPWLNTRTPFLTATLKGTIDLTDQGLAGRLSSPDFRVEDNPLPMMLELNGDLRSLNLEGTLDQSYFSANLKPQQTTGLIRFDTFPIESIIEAWLGDVDVKSSVTGALRFDLAQNKDSYLRFASERIMLERDGIVTEGELSLEIDRGRFIIHEANFQGEGSWQASGEASQEALNLRLNAEDADFSPLLGLVPQLAAFNVGAFGNVQLITSGSLLNPIIKAESPSLDIGIVGSTYRLSQASLLLQNTEFVTSGQLTGLAPLTGTLSLAGGGRLQLAPFKPLNLAIRFAGNTAVPVLGAISEVQGEITATPETSWQLQSQANLGNPFNLSGTLLPLDLRLQGDKLNLNANRYFLANSSSDVDMRLFYDQAFHLSGSLISDQAELKLGGRQNQAEGTPTQGRNRASRRKPVLERIRFDDISITAPQQILWEENFGSGELGLDNIILSGTAARPQLSGQAKSLRGNLRFAGRDFTIEQATASFEPSRGLLPLLDIFARTRFDKQQVLIGPAASRISFFEPRGSANFDVFLALTGEVVAQTEGPRAFDVDLNPLLSSNASIQENTGNGTLFAPRPFTEPELFSLLTLGRLELSANPNGEGNIASSLAQGAFDTAIDFLILAELQRELGEALGLDLLEIRTTPLGALLTGNSDEGFGVSLRIGGYLSNEIFATYQIGSLDLDEDVALSNEFNVRYTLEPLEFTVIGRVNFLRNEQFTPVPEVDVSVGYAFSPIVRLEAGIGLSTAEQGLRFGVGFRW